MDWEPESNNDEPVRRHERLSVAIVGFGRIAQEDHLSAVLASETVNLVAVVDPDVGALENLPPELDVRTFLSVDQLLANCQPDMAVVSLPHDQYLETLRNLASQGVNVLKEKPLAVSLEEAESIADLVAAANCQLMITRQRRFNPLFKTFNQLKQHIGSHFHFDFRYTMSVPNLETGWRGNRRKAGGGCLIDMGYHTIDLILWYFGMPDLVQATLQRSGRPSQTYDVEDTCNLRLIYHRSGGDLIGNVLLSRVFPRREETLTLVGSEGMVVLDRRSLTRFDARGEVKEHLERQGEWPSAYLDQLNSFASWVADGPPPGPPMFLEHVAHVAVIEAAYLSAETGSMESPRDLLRRRPSLGS